VVPDRDEKSISAEETFATDLGDIAALQRELLRLADRTATRLRAQGLVAACVTVKIRRSDFTTYTRQRSFQPASQDTALIHRFAAGLLEEWRRLNPRQAVRLLGVGVSDLQPSAQSDLFAATPAKESRLDHAVDDIRRRFGSALLTRASLLPPDGDEEEPGRGPS
jgi:DNA polymerase-4